MAISHSLDVIFHTLNLNVAPCLKELHPAILKVFSFYALECKAIEGLSK